MNKEEAVEVLQDYLNEIRGFVAFEVGSALNLAIEALSDRPTDEWCTDCNLCEWFCIGVENDDYCSHGERRK